jgi:adenine-specific DNA methylase
MSILVKNKQATLFEKETFDRMAVFPSTRYQGSKTKIIDWIKFHTQNLNFDSALDAFSGTCSVAYMYKQLGKRVFCNDYLKFNYTIGKALIENSNVFLDENDIAFILKKHEHLNYSTFIQETFKNIYYTDEENAWLDQTITNIKKLDNQYKRALSLFALFQACIIKRPFNLFHRKNLYIRTANVSRSFGNKKTWDTSFEQHFLKFIQEANDAVFDNGKENKAINCDIFDSAFPKVDLVYIDTPYISKKGIGVNYFDFYHFLEGIVNYNDWRELIDENSKHKKIKNGSNEWCNKGEIHSAFRRLFNKFRDSILVVSYRSDGIPSIEELTDMLTSLGKVIEIRKMNYKYVLSSNGDSKETLIIAQ